VLAREVLERIRKWGKAERIEVRRNSHIFSREGKRVLARAREGEHSVIEFHPEKPLGDALLLFIPGFTGAGDNLGILAKELAYMGMEAHVLQLPGQGGPMWKEYDRERVVEHIAQYAKKVAGNRPVLLVGHSLGGELVKYVAEKLKQDGIVVDTVHLAPAGRRTSLRYRIGDWFMKTPVGARLAIRFTLRGDLKGLRKGFDPRAVQAYGKMLQEETMDPRGGAFWRGTYLYGSKDNLVPHQGTLWRYREGIPQQKGQRIITVRGDHDITRDLTKTIAREIVRAARRLETSWKRRKYDA